MTDLLAARRLVMEQRMVRRVQLDLTSKSMDRLNVLKTKTEATSYAEVIKNALRLYEALIEETESGKQFFIKDKFGAMAGLKLWLS